MTSRQRHRPHPAAGRGAPPGLADCARRIGLRRGAVSSLPLVGDDATAGAENELQVAVTGGRADVDLPQVIAGSGYFAHVQRQAAAGETPRRAVADLEAFLAGNREGVWENSWVRFPRRYLGAAAARALAADLAGDGAGGQRSDAGRFRFVEDGEEWLRLPVSYLLKLALLDAADGPPGGETVRRTASRLATRFINDNSSPETLSFSVVSLDEAGGRALARETARRFLFTQLLIAYANRRFRLEEHGQRALVFFSPLPPERQRQLNRLIPDTFYRELFISPCLSGWERGEEKRDYMALCHQVLSRSQLNGLVKLREAGIITRNLVVLPRTSNLSLANNGTHVSLGSRRLSALLADPASGFGADGEKLLADLAVKAAEHFLPLFVGTYSAAPYRLDFADFHPEQVLGFLPHQLEPTHLRMLWRRWRGKAANRFFGRSLTPFGPPTLDRAASVLLGLAGDLVPDFRLVEYPVALLSTAASPALDGSPGSGERLKRDLEGLGVHDARMPLYLPLRPRAFAAAGFSGFELRTLSLFAGFEEDLGAAVDLQRLVTAFAFQLVADGRLTHAHIPDHPFVESERRQLLFAAALGLPTVYVRERTPNRYLLELLGRTEGIRFSRRYPGYLRVRTVEYARALVKTLRREARELAEALGGREVLDDLEERLLRPAARSVAGRLVADVLEETGAPSPLRLDAATFNQGAERFYRERLRRRHLSEAAEVVAGELRRLDADPRARDAASPPAALLALLLGAESAAAFFARLRPALEAETLGLAQLTRLIRLLIVYEAFQEAEVEGAEEDRLTWSTITSSTSTSSAVPAAS